VDLLLTQAQAKLRSELADAGFAAFADRFVQSSRSAAHFSCSLKEDDEIPVGASKVGGSPDLPSHFPWPKHRRMQRQLLPNLAWRERKIVGPQSEEHLSFVAQLNLADVDPGWIDLEMPRHGLLTFFYDAEQQPWGFDPIDKGGWQLAWIDTATSKLVRTAQPDPQAITFYPARLEPKLLLTFPEQVVTILNLEEQRAAAFFEFLDGRRKDGVQFGGDPALIQGQMEEECDYVSRGYYMGDPEGYNEARAACPGADIAQWRLLLQISSIDAAGIMWGDEGNLYVWARASDIKQRRFEDAWTILQCT